MIHELSQLHFILSENTWGKPRFYDLTEIDVAGSRPSGKNTVTRVQLRAQCPDCLSALEVIVIPCESRQLVRRGDALCENIRCPSSRLTDGLCGYRGLVCTNTMSHRGRTDRPREAIKETKNTRGEMRTEASSLFTVSHGQQSERTCA